MSDSDRYVPIDCGFHDELQALATLQRPTHITYRDAQGATNEVTDVIEDVFTRSGAEYLRLSSGTEIRLDRLVKVDDDPDAGEGETLR